MSRGTFGDETFNQDSSYKDMLVKVITRDVTGDELETTCYGKTYRSGDRQILQASSGEMIEVPLSTVFNVIRVPLRPQEGISTRNLTQAKAEEGKAKEAEKTDGS